MRNLAAVLAIGVAVCAAAEPPFYEDKQNLLQYRAEDGAMQPVRTADDWAHRREHTRANFQAAAGPMPGDDRKVALAPEVVETVDMGRYERHKVLLRVEEGDRLPVYLLLPKGGDDPRPAVLCLHPTSRPNGKGQVTGMGDKENRDYAVELAERGYVTLAPDYPNMGEYEVDPYAMGYASTTMKAIWNHMRCIDYLQSLPEVNGDRIATIGHSLGGHNALFLGLFDERVQCMVTSCGFCSFPTYYGGDLSGWSHAGYMPRIAEVYEKDPERMPFDFTEILGSLAPRFVFISAPLEDANFDWKGVRDCVNAAIPIYRLYDAETYLEVRYPDCDHDFPPETRNAAYRFIDAAFAALNNTEKSEAEESGE